MKSHFFKSGKVLFRSFDPKGAQEESSESDNDDATDHSDHSEESSADSEDTTRGY